ncbi:zf-CSL-domain-containing protein [Suillus discolor]|uniref:Diphthamide biosynthesis protein 3 n=1 Tax=Suillus discolor TaxID=1912936 RepID=A0A9P7FJV2_9AGAM|nr:zf-CSL-domain-containing protein [Suillus discolor]KAG2118695.1 zf-CSL-domain-containing protein [Suillus discolor]
MGWDEVKGVYHYPCPCGDRFEISRKQLVNYEDIATCPSCSLIIRVVYDPLDFEDEPPDDSEESASEKSEENEEVDDDSDADTFEDALEKLTLSERSAATVATAASDIKFLESVSIITADRAAAKRSIAH